MTMIAEDCYVVYVREDSGVRYLPTERKLRTCRTYEEAESVRRENRAPDRQCIIRFVGPSGGGD